VLFLTIPTAGSHPELLSELIESSELPSEQIVIIQTRPGVELPAGVIVIEDFGPPNIQKWWKTGIEESVARGAAVVAVLNDDIRIPTGSLQILAGELKRSGATIASPSRPPKRDRVYRRPLVPYEPRLWGCYWLLDVSSGLLPDTDYSWWFGDNDLDIRARRDYSGVLNFNVPYEHFFPGEGTDRSPVLQKLVEQDTRRYQEQNGRLLFWTHWFNKIFHKTRQG
jgi:hypothetical protein